MMIRATLAATALLLTAGAASADETWDTDFGLMIWESDMDATAVLLLTDDTGGTTRFFVDGLAADMNGGRGHYTGVWIAAGKAEDSGVSCGVAMVDPLGESSMTWGRFQITFVSPEFPSDWAGTWGACTDQPLTPIAGVAPR